MIRYNVEQITISPHWPLPIHNSGEMQVVFREIRQTLEYFSACMDFLFMHEKEYSDA